MLQVSNLTKIYKTKGGVEVKALDNVSLSFPETGMVFLLGKSGSGKSTLLNVCGGLDSPTDGEIIVKGRSSKNFSQSDFDSYRNTYIGFIFQEYNILNEFSVEDNIALALELQGKPKDKKAIAQLLEDVDLSGYAKRKPNTLSGGQKQRIAIARALIKAPQIIMADEPTGALDSATGKQVFDTLKKLSKTKLVIVVSHDRDFAEQYGDRIIELKDGQILSDLSKTHEQQRAVSENVTFIGNTVSVKNGADLTDRDFGEIRAFLKKVNGNIMIASGKEDVQTFRSVARITDDGQKEVFRETNEDAIERKEYSAKDSKFIRSRLPARHAFKIGVSGLKTKPIRLFFTILLCTVAFILFGLASTMTFYDSATTFKQSFIDSNLQTVRAVKEYRETEFYYYNGKQESSWNYYYDAGFTAEEVAELGAKFGADAFGAVVCSLSPSTQTSSPYYRADLDYLATLSANSSLREKVIGKYPQTDSEIMITTYTAKALKECKGYDNKGNPLNLQNTDDLIGKTLNFGRKEYTVVGLLPVEDLPSKFDAIRENGNDIDWSLMTEFESALNDSYRLVAFVTENELREASKREADKEYIDYGNRPIYTTTVKDENGNYTYPTDNQYSNGYYYGIAPFSTRVTFLDNTQTDLSNSQTVIRAYQFYSYAYEKFNLFNGSAYTELDEKQYAWRDQHQQTFGNWRNQLTQAGEYDPFLDYDFDSLYWNWRSYFEGYGNADCIPPENHAIYPIYQSWQSEVFPLLEKGIYWNNLMKATETLRYGYEYTPDKGELPLTEERQKELVNSIIAALKEHDITFKVSMQLYDMQDGKYVGARYELDVVGVLDLYSLDNNHYEDLLILNDEFADELWKEQKAFSSYYTERVTKYKPIENEIYGAVFLPYNHTVSATDSLHSIYKDRNILDERDTRVKISCSLTETIEMVDSLIVEMSKIFLIAGIVMASFAALLLSNFISVSISHKKRDIGILRAVGARGTDVFKIFFSESFVITAICVAISLLGSIVLCSVLNTQIGAGLGVSIFNFGILSLATLLGIALLTALLATFLPVWLAARKKPVESIRAL